MVQVAGSRWTVARCFEEAKGEVGWISTKCGVGRDGIGIWTLAMWAYALLTVLRAANLSAALLAKKNAPTSTPSSLTAFKASRGLVCR